MSSNFMPADIASLLGASSTSMVTNSTSRKNNTELTMQDFLQLMIVQLQNQTMDDTMDTSEMMNQMVQMQMVTAITNMTEATTMTYASSLVGKVVTIGILSGDSLEEREVEVIGTGVSNGQQVIFGKDDKGNVETYTLNQIMAVGSLPPIESAQKPQAPGEVDDETVESVDKTPENKVEPQQPAESQSPAYDGTQGIPTDENS